MFTGIVNGQGRVQQLDAATGALRLSVELPKGLTVGLAIGASVAIDGVCLTTSNITNNNVTFDVMQETLSRTTLSSLKVGDFVNVERAAREGSEVGGHILSGHIDCKAQISEIKTPENNHVLTFVVPAASMKYIFAKGYVALNGTSLTVSNVNKLTSSFEVWLIPETLRVTTFGYKKVGDYVNLEIERNTQVIVDTVRDYLDERLATLIPNLKPTLG